jgi:phage terminase large subunit GpA-like protein
MILPSHGRGVGPTARPIHDGKKKPGERLGPGWKIGTVSGQRGLLFDANHWKSFLAARLNTTVGDPGAITYHQGEHHQLLDHLTSEQPIAVTARGRTVDEWKLLPGRENHFLDCCVLATVAASAAGITAVGAEMAPERQRRRVEVPKPGAQRKTIATRRR